MHAIAQQAQHAAEQPPQQQQQGQPRQHEHSVPSSGSGSTAQQPQQHEHSVPSSGSGSAAQQPQEDDIAPLRQADFEAAMLRVGPSVTRGAATELTPASWEEVGGLADVKARLR